LKSIHETSPTMQEDGELVTNLIEAKKQEHIIAFN
jgi:hypothetical protein